MPVLLRLEATKLRKETGEKRWYTPMEKLDRSIQQVILIFCTKSDEAEFPIQTIMRSFYRSFLLLMLEPMCLCLCIFCAFILSVFYLFFGAFNIVFTKNHEFNLWQVGLSFLGILIGMLIGIGSDTLYALYTKLSQLPNRSC